MKNPRARILPVLLWRGEGLVKTVKFSDARYIGDPINAVKIFNDSEVDEIIILDLTPDVAKSGPRFELLANLTTECFMPLCYGGGVRTVEQARRLYSLGIEKVAFNTALIDAPEVVGEVSRIYGISSVVASIDVKKNLWGKAEAVVGSGKRKTGLSARELAVRAEKLGCGEILLTAVDREGTGAGFDLKLIAEVASAVKIPVVAHGGAGKLADFAEAIRAGASAAAAGRLFVYHGKLDGILINYPKQEELKRLL